jgi:hypothetical protein
MFALCSAASGQQGKSKTSLTGRWEGTAKDKAEEVITLTLDLTEKEGTLSGTIKSSHGDFPIVGGWREGEKVTLEFDARAHWFYFAAHDRRPLSGNVEHGG